MTVKKTTNNFGNKPGPGRPKGVPNKSTQAIKDMIIAALDKAGGADYLLEQSEKNPTAFMGLLGKVLPMQVDAKVAGEILAEVRHKIVGRA